MNYRLALASLVFLVWCQPILGFCGFYVAKADANLYNKASQVIFVRHGERSAITLFSDYKGDPKEFALVVPVPEVLTREQINVADKSLIQKIDAYSAPRLVEYFDRDPCEPIRVYESVRMMAPQSGKVEKKDRSLGVSIEAKYSVGEYDILILSAKESSGLEIWLNQNGYRIPKGASKALQPYIKQDMKFFVAKVNLKQKEKLGFSALRPIQFAFESKKFMLPIRLGMLNAEGPQDMLVYMVTKKGRVETTNYRSVKLPTGMDLPIFVKRKFASFYRAMFDTVYEKEKGKVVFTEYAWNMSWCDPCAADPLTTDELRKIGVFWLEDETNNTSPKSRIGIPVRPVTAYITRLHVRYEKDNFPEDLFFQETSDTTNFQGRYVIRHPWVKKERTCAQVSKYRENLRQRRQKEAKTLASLTGWSLEDIYNEMGSDTTPNEGDGKKQKWYEKIFK